MATPMLKDNGRHAFRAPVTGTRKPATGVKVTIKNYSTEPASKRRTRHAAETGTSRGAWK